MNLKEYCQKTTSSDLLNIFKHNARIIICGASYSGKSQLCTNLLIQYINIIDLIIIADSPNKQEFQDIPELNSKINVFEHIPSIIELNSSFDSLKHKVIVLDDNYVKAFNSEIVLNYFIKGRHDNISVILICHNLFFTRARYSRDISLNATHFILMKLRDLNQVSYLAMQIYGKNDAKKVLNVYKYILSKYSFPHLLIDVSITSNTDIELRSNIIFDHSINKFETCYKSIE